MKDRTETELRGGRPRRSLAAGVQFCLRRLFEDKIHATDEEVVRGLTFEEMIGVLLRADDAVRLAGRPTEEREDGADYG